MSHRPDDTVQAQILDQLSIAVGGVPEGNDRDAPLCVRLDTAAFQHGRVRLPP